MTRDNLLFAIIGVLFGFIVGFLFASTMNQRYGPGASPAALSSGQMPADHPPLGAGGPASGNMQAEVTAQIDEARKQPKNFDAQVKAAELFYKIGRCDPAIEFLLKANQLKPDDYQTLVALGLVNLDAGHYEVAEKWYKAALQKKPDDLRLLDGYCHVLLESGNAKAAEAAIAQLAKADPTNQDLEQFRTRLAKLKSGGGK